MNLRIACKIIKRDYMAPGKPRFRWGLHFKAQDRYFKWWKRHKGQGREVKDKLRAVRDADGVLRERRPAPVSLASQMEALAAKMDRALKRLAQCPDCLYSDEDSVFLVSRPDSKTGEKL